MLSRALVDPRECAKLSEDTQTHMKKATVLLERFPYRYVQCGMLENGFPDYRIQKVDSYTGKYGDMYLCDNAMQLDTAMEDFEYTKWLDPDGVPCYVKENVSRSVSN